MWCLCVGFTLNTLLHSDGTGDATVLQTHRYTPPEQLLVNAKQADIIVVACGETYVALVWDNIRRPEVACKI